MICEYCGKSFPAKRKDAKCCSPKCRTYKSREQKRAALVAQSMTLSFESYAKIEAISKFAPKTADTLNQFIQDNGVVCAAAAIALVLTAYHEAKGGTS